MSENLAKLDEYSLPGHQEISWTLTSGVVPFIRTFEMVPDDALNLLFKYDAGNPITLKAGTAATSFEFENLYILGETAPSSPKFRAVQIADRRWLWPRHHIVRMYNVRRRTGSHRFINAAGTASLDVAQFDPEWGYLLPSLKNGTTPWTPREILEDVLDELVGLDNVEYSPSLDTLFDSYVAENIELDDPGHQALNRIMQFMPGIEISLTSKGRVWLYNQLDENDRGDPDLLAYRPILSDGRAEYVKHHLQRPSKVRVLFTPEIEVRFDFAESDATRTRTQRYMTNVLPVPDVSVDINGKIYQQGSWVEFSDTGIFDAWGTPVRQDDNIQIDPLTLAMIRKAYIWGQLIDQYAEAGYQARPNSRWRERIAAVYQHWHTTFQLNPEWSQRVMNISPMRVAIVNPENGTRAPAAVFMDYTEWLHGVFSGVGRPGVHNRTVGWNILGWNANLKATAATQAPATVRMLDADSGVLAVNLLPHYLSHIGNRYPFALANIPTQSAMSGVPQLYRIDEKGNRYPEGGESYGVMAATDVHQCAVLLTMTPMTPNDNRRLFAVDVTPADVATVLGVETVGLCEGPEAIIRVPQSIWTAKFAWDDDYADQIEAAFGMFELSSAQLAAKSGVFDVAITVGVEKYLSELLINRDEIESIAKAVAAEYYSQFFDHIVGSWTTDARPGLLPQGSMTSVTHTLAPDGSVLTHQSFQGTPPRVNMMSVLNDQVRRVILRMHQWTGNPWSTG